MVTSSLSGIFKEVSGDSMSDTINVQQFQNLLGQASITQDQALGYLAQQNAQSQAYQNQLAAQQNYFVPSGSKISLSSGDYGSVIYADDKPQCLQETKPMYRKTILSYTEVHNQAKKEAFRSPNDYLDKKYGKGKWRESENYASYEITEEIPPGTELRMTTYSGLMYDPSGKSWTSNTQTVIIPDKKPKEKHYMDSLKQYFGKHRDLFITMAVIFLADHFLFGGKFKQKITESVEKLLDKSIKTLQGEENGQK